MSYDFTGIAPPYSDFATFCTPKTDKEILKASILFIVMTAKGERVMLPEFGTDIQKKVFDQNDATLQSAIENEISQAVALWDPRIEIISIETIRKENEISCKILYKDKRDQESVPNEVVVALG